MDSVPPDVAKTHMNRGMSECGSATSRADGLLVPAPSGLPKLNKTVSDQLDFKLEGIYHYGVQCQTHLNHLGLHLSHAFNLTMSVTEYIDHHNQRRTHRERRPDAAGWQADS
jgi:hypothetical protein